MNRACHSTCLATIQQQPETEQSCSAQQHSKHTQQPAMDEDNAYMRHLEQVYTGAPVLSGTQPESNPEQSQYSSYGIGNENLVARTFAALPSTYQSRLSRPPGRKSDSRTEYWRNNSCVYSTITWNGKMLNLPVVGQKNGIGRNHLTSPCLRICTMDPRSVAIFYHRNSKNMHPSLTAAPNWHCLIFKTRPRLHFCLTMSKWSTTR